MSLHYMEVLQSAMIAGEMRPIWARLSVPGGWLYIRSVYQSTTVAGGPETLTGYSETVTFVADPDLARAVRS